MKRFLSIILAAALVAMLAACGQSVSTSSGEQHGQNPDGGVGIALVGAGPSGTGADTSNSPEPRTIFTDVPANAWYAQAVEYCRNSGLMSGTTGITFSPNTTTSRAMLATILYRQAGSQTAAQGGRFSDVALDSWYGNAVAWAAANGMMSGYSDDRFGPNDPVTREQISTILWRYAGSPSSGQGTDFADEGGIAAFAAQAVDWARERGIISGKEGNRFDPKGNATRAEVAVILQRYLDEGGDTDTPQPEGESARVFMTTDISSAGLMAVYQALGVQADGDHVAVKLSTGEPGSNFLPPALIKDLVQEVDGTIVECNTAYGGSRANTAMHYQVAADHGYTALADVDIMDEEGSMTLPVAGGTNLTENYVGASFADYDYFVVLSHFKGHSMAGFGGAIKNSSIGIASAQGKSWIHSGGTRTSGLSGEQDAFLESMAEAGKSVVDALGGNILYINVMNRLSVDCDCDGNPAQPDMHDIGILASTDPVALDQACVDLVYAAQDGASLVRRMESRNGLHTLEHADAIGLGSKTYTLVPIAPPDDPTATPPSDAPTALQIQVQDETHTIVFELNSSPAARSLYDQLPLTIAVQDYSDNEKIFYPPQVLDTTDAIPAEGPAGTLAYFAPWGDVVMYYSSCGPYGGLYALGNAVSGGEQIENLTGTLQITQILQ